MGGYHGPAEWRFWRHVEKSDGCWIWQAARNPRGYGKFGVTPRLVVPAHRFAFETAVGPIPDGLCVLHHCDNPPCVRPDHLFLGTRRDNWQDAHEKGRAATPPHRFGEQHGGARLTDAAVRAMRVDPRSQRQIAAAYGVAKSTVARIQRRMAWAHLPTEEGATDVA